MGTHICLFLQTASPDAHDPTPKRFVDQNDASRGECGVLRWIKRKSEWPDSSDRWCLSTTGDGRRN